MIKKSHLHAMDRDGSAFEWGWRTRSIKKVAAEFVDYVRTKEAGELLRKYGISLPWK